ncbi:unnamed protein product, partial [Closterium sp. Naga37s-1]
YRAPHRSTSAPAWGAMAAARPSCRVRAAVGVKVPSVALLFDRPPSPATLLGARAICRRPPRCHSQPLRVHLTLLAPPAGCASRASSRPAPLLPSGLLCAVHTDSVEYYSVHRVQADGRCMFRALTRCGWRWRMCCAAVRSAPLLMRRHSSPLPWRRASRGCVSSSRRDAHHHVSWAGLVSCHGFMSLLCAGAAVCLIKPTSQERDRQRASYEALQFVSGLSHRQSPPLSTVLSPTAALSVARARMEGFQQDWGLSLHADTLLRAAWQGGIILAGPGIDNLLFLHKVKAGDEPDVRDIIAAASLPLP